MEIKSSLLNYKEFSHTKESLIKVSEKDGKEKFRIKVLEYINDSSDENDDMFFYDMLPYVRFLYPSSKAIAYTKPDKRIFLNCPNEHVGESIRQWEFTYDHECLHQLWDTFGVAEYIKSENIEYNHELLNIASDCIINDYLYRCRKKDMPEDLITPEYLLEKYEIEYDHRVDTQLSLYLKLLDSPKKKEMENDQKKRDQQQSGGNSQNQESDDDDSQDNSNSQDNKSQDNNGGSSKSSNKNDKDDNDETEESGEGSDNKGKKGKEGKDSKASGQEDKGSQNKDSKDSGQEDKSSKETGEEKNDKGESEENGAAKKGNPEGRGGKGNSGEPVLEDEDLDEIRKKAEEIINKYKQKIGGLFGQFIQKCKSSAQMQREGLTVKVSKGISAWNTKLNKVLNAYIRGRVNQKKRRYEETYKRIKRGSGFVEFGQPLQKGRQVKKESMIINVAFYVDKSGSMTGRIDRVFAAAYEISEGIKKAFGKESVVKDTLFKMFVFDDKMKEIKWGQKAQASGVNMSFPEMVEFIKDNTNDFLVNIIITDAGFPIDKTLTKKFLKSVNGAIVFITNTESPEMKELSNEVDNKIFYILSDKEFRLDS